MKTTTKKERGFDVGGPMLQGEILLKELIDYSIMAADFLVDKWKKSGAKITTREKLDIIFQAAFFKLHINYCDEPYVCMDKDVYYQTFLDNRGQVLNKINYWN